MGRTCLAAAITVIVVVECIPGLADKTLLALAGGWTLGLVLPITAAYRRAKRP